MHTIKPALTRSFARHYLEMVVVMFVGMALLALPAQWATDALWPGVDGDDTTLMLARMGATMTLPMIPWMRWRGHGWQPSLEMAAAMIVPAIGVVAMLAVMIARPDEYSHAAHGGDATARTVETARV